MLSAAAFLILTVLSSITFVSPYPGSVWQSPESRIIVNTSGDASRVRALVFGSQSGDAVLSVHLTPDGRTTVFTPQTPFTHGETVTVTVDDSSWDFTVWPDDPAPKELPEEGHEAIVPNLGPDLLTGLPEGFPGITFTPSGTLAEGYFLFAPIYFGTSNDESYLVIMDNEGEPVMYRREKSGIFCVEVQSDGYLSYGLHRGVGNTWFYELDQSLCFVDSFHVEGYGTDIHDFSVLQDNNILLVGVVHQIIDMSQYVPGGDPNALVKGCILQIQDRDHVPIFQWNSFDHIAVTDVATWVDLTSDYIDYIHCNSADEDVDGDLLISALGLCAGVKISRSTGDVIWSLGGTHATLADFTIVGDPLGGFNGQHDFKGFGGGTYTLFDNGAHHVSQQSRALVYQVDTLAMTATLSWSHSPGIYGSHAGSVQRMPDWTMIVGWGTVNGPADDFHEVSGSGEVRASCRYIPLPLDS
ncbi:MAG: aryl-sulfate sulfotransferase, partial [Candidatus Fermentibacteraceae bacterium]|nr:aryl-sulfate sulfotransferase [Candidatus Fermentibacteraceae bacterium]